MTTTSRFTFKSIALGALLGLMTLSFVPGCQVTLLKPTSEDTVRERVAAVEQRNEQLVLENAGLKARLQENEASLTRDEAAIEAAMPRLSALAIASSSVVEEGAGGRRELTLRLAPADDRGRFMQIVGNLSVRVIAVPDDGPPIPLAVARFDPLEVREAWRGGVFGTGYVFQIPLSGGEAGPLPETVDVVMNFTDATTGIDLRDEQPVRVSDSGV